jgi:galactokinase
MVGDAPSPQRLAAVAASFERRHGRRPDGVWAAPGRVNLIGEHTDYNDGWVLPVAIDRHVLVAAGRRVDGLLSCWSSTEGEGPVRRLVDLGPGGRSGWWTYPQGAAWALQGEGIALDGADVVVDADLPAGAGLASSAALLAAVALALADLHGARLAPALLARAAQRAEGEVVGTPSGVMDHLVVLLGRGGHALFLDTRSLAATLVPLDLAGAGLQLVVIDTGVAHHLADGAYAERRAACEEAARLLHVTALRDASVERVDGARSRLGDTLFRRARHVVTENARVLEAVSLLRRGAAAELGPVLARSHASLRDDFEVSTPELDVAVAAARAAGAVGARLTGAGFGGSALALVATERLDQVAQRVGADFARRGFAAPSVFPVQTGDGARRVG